MKKIIITSLFITMASSAYASGYSNSNSSTPYYNNSNNSSVDVSGYTRSNGSYVNSYERSSPDNTTSNNWSTKGNINPYTGQEGTKNGY